MKHERRKAARDLRYLRACAAMGCITEAEKLRLAELEKLAHEFEEQQPSKPKTMP